MFETASRLAVERGAKGPRLEALAIREAAKGEPPSRPAEPLTALVLPPSLEERHDPARTAHLAPFLKDRHREGTILCSVCAGAFLLAQTGLLAGRPATTHWALGEAFAREFPDVALDTQKILIDDGDIVTAGGVMAWVDLALLLVTRLLGPSVMLATARRWVVDPGGREQRFYGTFAPILTHGDEAILAVQHWMHERRTERLSLATMARRAKMGERTFLRRFAKVTGHTPTEYLHHLRVERARDLLEMSAQSFDEIARRLGYEDPGAFRRVFARILGLTPGEYRRRFAVRAAGLVRGDPGEQAPGRVRTLALTKMGKERRTPRLKVCYPGG